MKANTRVSLLLGAGLAVVTVLAAACGGDDDTDATPTELLDGDEPATSITVNLTNWAVEPSSTVAKAGAVTFTAVHEEEHGGHGAGEGGVTHQLVVARLEDGAEVGELRFGAPALNLADIPVGEEKTGEAVLEPGRYELSCLVVEDVDGNSINHYEEGMHALLTVE